MGVKSLGTGEQLQESYLGQLKAGAVPNIHFHSSAPQGCLGKVFLQAAPGQCLSKEEVEDTGSGTVILAGNSPCSEGAVSS